MPEEPDEFEGIDISGPWGGIRIGSGGRRFGGPRDWDEDAEVRRVRRHVRQRLDFYRHLTYFVVVIATIIVVEGIATGSFGAGWVGWVAGIWGAFLALQFLTTFVAPSFWGRETEERMIRDELAKRGIRHAPPPEPAPDVDDE